MRIAFFFTVMKNHFEIVISIVKRCKKYSKKKSDILVTQKNLKAYSVECKTLEILLTSIRIF